MLCCLYQVHLPISIGYEKVKFGDDAVTYRPDVEFLFKI
jgi:hypothetical protein